MLWLRQLTFASHRGGLISIPVRVRFAVEKVALRQGFLLLLWFSPVSSIPQFSTLIFIYVLLLSERQMGEAWEPFLRQCSLDIGEHLIADYFYLSRVHRLYMQVTAQATVSHVSGCSSQEDMCSVRWFVKSSAV